MSVDRLHVIAALPDYEVGAELGSGSFGMLFSARHRGTDRRVAVKVLATADEDDRADFHAEARVLAAIDHPHVVRFHDYIEAEGLCLIVMELLPGGTLSDRRAGMPPEDACAVGLAVADALDATHRQGVLHLDVKPDNILFGADGLLKVTDFGIAEVFEGTTTTARVIAGTAKYMAPEQGGGARLGPATDLYALACVLYELLAGVPPFDPTLPADVLMEHRRTTPPPRPPGVPAPVADVIMRALAGDPRERHPSARAFALDVADAAARGYGPRWAARSGIVMRLSDEVREAAGQPVSVPAARVPAPEETDAPAAAPPPEATAKRPLRSRLSGRTAALACTTLLGALVAAGGWALAGAESGSSPSSPPSAALAPPAIPAGAPTPRASTRAAPRTTPTPEPAAPAPAAGTPAPARAPLRRAPAPAAGPGAAASPAPVPERPRRTWRRRNRVPDVRGSTLADALSRLKAAGFHDVSHRYGCYRSRDVDRVVRQSPDGGSRYGRGRSVSLTLQASTCRSAEDSDG
jgi:serine/threonine-protein kinase